MPAWGLIPDSPFFYYGGKAIRATSRANRGSASFKTTIKVQRLVIYKPILNFELNNPSGMVGQKMRKLGAEIMMDARRQVGVKTGALKRSIYMEHTGTAYRGQTIKVGSALNYAYMHHQGTRPHIITPNKPGGNLVFMKGSRVIRTPIVNHPGTRANKFLSDPMHKRVTQLRASFR